MHRRGYCAAVGRLLLCPKNTVLRSVEFPVSALFDELELAHRHRRTVEAELFGG